MTGDAAASALSQAPMLGLVLASLTVLVGIIRSAAKDMREWLSEEREQGRLALERTVSAHSDSISLLSETMSEALGRMSSAMDRLASQSEQTHEDTRALISATERRRG